MSFTVIKPLDWPQDTLNVPDGFRSMPPVEFGNRNVVGSEFFALSVEFTWPGGTAAGTTRRQTLATPQDGDFWCDSIGAVSWATLPDVVTRQAQAFLASVVTIRDIRTGLSLIYNPPIPNVPVAFPPDAVPVNLFRKLPQSGTEDGAEYDGSTPPPSGFRTTGTLIQPFCFTRQGGIEVTVTNLFAAPANTPFDLSIGFNGWKEYSNASR